MLSGAIKYGAPSPNRENDVLKTNANRTLRISLAAAAVLLFMFADIGFAAQTYKVQRGDTLYKIAARFNVSIAAIQSANKLRSANTIRTGQVLTIPTKASVQVVERVTYGYITEDNTEVTSDEKVLTALNKDAKIVVLVREGDKYKVKLADGKIGWVQADGIILADLKDKPQVAAKPAASATPLQASITQTALAYRGAAYKRGGMSSRGFDCSGFVNFVYASKGIKLPRDSRSLYKVGVPVSKSDLQPGDLVFFANTYRRGISHVGLYTGDGKFIHASTPRTGVRVDTLDKPYYAGRYAGARRIVKK